MFSGYKTYIVGGVAIITAIATYLVGDLTLADAAQACLTAILGMTVRAGVSSSSSN